MRRTKVAALATASLFCAAAMVPLATPSVAGPAAPDVESTVDGSLAHSDLRTMPWQKRYEAIRQAGLEQRLRSGGKGDVQKVGKGTFAKVAQTGTDKIFVVLAEFGDTRHSAFPDGETDATTYLGPLHNQIPKPDRTTDTSTIWQKDYSQAHFADMYDKRMKNFYETQSHGKYSVDGDVTEWVKVPFNQARYGRDVCGDVVCNNTWFLVRDALAQWTQLKLDDGWTMQRIQDYLKTFDLQDRYDFDEDGDFDEPDGYIDHFQIVHAGGDQADGDPVYGEDAIWSHRWNAQIEPYGTGPEGGAPIGGVNIGEGGPSDSGAVQIPDNPTGVWVNDYTIQPENGGLGVFAHEFGHDLGLPDLYDTSGNTGGADNNVGWWSLMSQSRGTAQGAQAIGDSPTPFGAWEKFQLGWLDYDVARSGRNSTHQLQPGASTKRLAANGLVVLLPDKAVPLELGPACDACGDRYYFSGSGDDLDNTMTAAVEVGADTELTAQVRYAIEPGFDYAFLEASSDDGETWTSLPTSESYTGDDEGGVNPDGTGISGAASGWVALTATVPAGTTALRWRYLTDPAVAESGFQVDNIALGGEVIGDAETDDGWQFDGFRTTTGSEIEKFLNAYFVDNRQYVGYDKLQAHLYNFGNAEDEPNLVEYFANQPGALISYWDTSYGDNNVGDHPGGGQILPVDAHPEFQHMPDGSLMRNRLLAFDSTFSLSRAKSQTLHVNGEAYVLKGGPAVPVFDDTLDWWYGSDEHGSVHPGRPQPGWYSVDVPKTGTTITVARLAKNGVMTVKVGTSS